MENIIKSEQIFSGINKINYIYDLGGTFILPESKEVLIKIKNTVKIYDIPGNRGNMIYNNKCKNIDHFYFLITENDKYSKINIYSIFCLLTLNGIIYDWYKKRKCIYYTIKKFVNFNNELSEENKKLIFGLKPKIYYNKKIAEYKEINVEDKKMRMKLNKNDENTTTALINVDKQKNDIENKIQNSFKEI